MLVWLNGRISETDDAWISVLDRGFTLGDGIFETMRVVGGRARHLDRHLDRLRQGAAQLALPLPDAPDRAVAELLSASRLTDGSLRLTISRGEGARGLLPPQPCHPTVLATISPWSPVPADIRVIVAGITRRNEHSPLSRVKSLNMLDNVLARREAAAAGADEALLLNTAGRVAEATTANIFALIDGRLVTPPISEGALPGIARAVAMDALTVVERPLAPADLARAEAIVLTNSLGVRAVSAIDGRPVGNGGTAPLFERVKSALEE